MERNRKLKNINKAECENAVGLKHWLYFFATLNLMKKCFLLLILLREI